MAMVNTVWRSLPYLVFFVNFIQQKIEINFPVYNFHMMTFQIACYFICFIWHLRNYSCCFCRCHFCSMLSHYMDANQGMVGTSGALNITPQLWNHWCINACAAAVDMAKLFPKNVKTRFWGWNFSSISNVILLGHICHKSVLHPIICIFL